MFVRYGKIWFCGLDAASSLQYKNPLKGLLEHCKPSSVMMCEVGDDIMEFINERSMYRLIYKSPFPPMADEFERWIFLIILFHQLPIQEVIMHRLDYQTSTILPKLPGRGLMSTKGIKR